jgi:hypothetical protein
VRDRNHHPNLHENHHPNHLKNHHPNLHENNEGKKEIVVEGDLMDLVATKTIDI